MKNKPLHLLRTRRFTPVFITQFLGAFNDNLFKNALIILILFRLSDKVAVDGSIMVTLAAGIFILPFFLFSALAGQLADKFEKSRQIRIIKLAEIIIMALGTLGFITGEPYVLIFVLFLMGVQSAFFGPLKYAILPDHLEKGELIGGNAFIEAGTFLAILLGTIGGGVIILTGNGIPVVCLSVMLLAVAGYASSRFIPEALPPSPDLKLNFNIASETWSLMKHTLSDRKMRLVILGISWFWLVGATFLSQFPALVKNVIGANEHVVTMFLTVFSLGIGIGSLLCNRLLSGEVSARFVPLGAIGISVFIIDFYFAVRGFPPPSGALTGAAVFVSSFEGWRLLADLVAIAISGGIFIVPLYTLLQSGGERNTRARTIAANNIINALFMVAGAAAAAILISLGAGIPVILLVIGLLNMVVAVNITRLSPAKTLRGILHAILRLAFRRS